MKKHLTIIGITFLLISCSAAKLGSKKVIPQSEPFINVLSAMKTDSATLFASAFSKTIIDGEIDTEVWQNRLNEGKEKFSSRFGDFKITDFTYNFDEEASKLIISYKEEEFARMKVVFEDDSWKLDEK